MKENLYFIAIVPNQEICREVTNFKEYAAANFQSARALRSPPHITLFPPFKWPGNQEQEILKSLRRFATKKSTFFLELENFDCFAPRVIFVDIVGNSDLNHLQKSLVSWLEKDIGLKNKDNRPYHPHMTIAFKDLKKEIFPQAWEYFSNQTYHRMFTVKEVVLLKHQEREWRIKNIIPFQ